jgi:cytochrome d ubiquinol oxidase subunit II
MSVEVVVAVIMWASVTLYAVLAGADFGAGLWDLVAGGSRRGARPRALIDMAIGPVWEVNHVWLVVCLVLLWTGFPSAFRAIMLTLYVPLGLAAVGIVLRGSGFAYRHATTGFAARRAFGAAFAISSVLTPFFLGAALGAVASGQVPLDGATGDPIASWWNVPGVYAGVLAVAACGWLAAVYLTNDARRLGAADLERYFTRRALVAGAVTGMVAISGLVVAGDDIPELYDGLTGQALPLVILSGVAGAATMWLVWRSTLRFSRLLAGVSVAAVVWGWGLAQEPWVLPGQVTVADAAAAPATLWAIVVAIGVAAVVLVPSLLLLFRLDQAGRLEIDSLDDEALLNLGAAPAAPSDP